METITELKEKKTCPYSLKLSLIEDDIGEMKCDIKSLLKFKWQIMGGTGAMAFIATALIAIIK